MKAIKDVLSGKGLPRRGEKGFTLVELLIVLAILAVLAAVVIPNVTGMFGRGASQAYDTDQETIQMSCATFYFDVHDFDPAASKGWNEGTVGTGGHYYPTANGEASGCYLDTLYEDAENPGALLIKDAGGANADAADITAAAIWMSLLVNSPDDGAVGVDAPPGDLNSPMDDEKGPYLNEISESCTTTNSGLGNGSYTWIIGEDGKVYGAYSCTTIKLISSGAETTGTWWVAGFGGVYP